MVKLKSSWDIPTLADWLNEVDESTAWLIPGFIPEDSLTLISGQKKRACKTYFAMTAALCLAAKKKVELLDPVRKIPVLFVEEEGTAAGTKTRVLALCKGIGIDPAKLTNIHWAFRRGVKLDNPAWPQRVYGKMEEIEPGLVVLDAMTYLHNGDENRVKDMGVVVEVLQEIRRRKAAVLFLNHTGKDFGGGERKDPDDEVRGTGLFTDCYDQHLALRRKHSDDPFIKLRVSSRDDEAKRYQVSWTFLSEKRIDKQTGREYDHLVEAKPHMICVEEGNPELMAEVAAQKLVVGDTYLSKGLRSLWDLSAANTNLVCEVLVEQGRLVKNNKSYIAVRQET